MYIHFEDWSEPLFVEMLDKKGLPHDGRIIKVFADVDDPRVKFEQSGLTVIEGNSAAFSTEESFDYGERGAYSGPQLEETLAAFDLDETGEFSIRSLFRFSNEFGFCQAAMSARKEGQWLIDHPFGDLDGVANATSNPARSHGIHLDIFFPDSIVALREVVDFDDPTRVLDPMKAVRLRRKAN